MNVMVLSARILLCIALSSAAGAARSESAGLSELATELRAMKTAPFGSLHSSICQRDLSFLKGETEATVRVHLGNADVQDGSSWTYYFSGPSPPNRRGGGFPVLRLIFDDRGAVEATECSYAR